MKLQSLKLHSDFRGLPKGFELHFRKNNYLPIDEFEPICMVGLNGSGKSNTLEAICEIFYYLELKTIASGKEIIDLDNKYEKLGFEIDYTISALKWKTVINRSIEKLSIGENAVVTIQCRKSMDDKLKITAISENIATLLPEVLWKEILPNKIIGYSSGQNELISNPFIKLDFHYFDEFIKSTSEKTIANNTDVNRMFFMDYESNELVVLANYLFQEHDLLNWADKTAFNEKLKIKHLHSFSIRIQFKNYSNKYIAMPSELILGIENLKRCATTYTDNEGILLAFIENEIEKEIQRRKQIKKIKDLTESELESIKNLIRNRNLNKRVIDFSFFTDAAVRKAFRNTFKTPYELFRFLYLMRLMNIHCISPAIRNNIKNAKLGTNLSDLIPKPAVSELVFKIERIQFYKSNALFPVKYKQLSDGEHQLMHVIGTLRLMNENDTLFILDEPETHFNPDWRAKMVRLIMSNQLGHENFQDHFITSHSPFIISDCKPNNVYLFNRTKTGLNVQTAHDRRLNTFGTSVNILTEEVFNKNESQGDYSLEVLNEIKSRDIKTIEDVNQAKDDARVLGESVEKTLLFRKILMIEESVTLDTKTSKKRK